MDRRLLVHLALAFVDQLLVAGAHLGHLFDPRRAAMPGEVQPQAFRRVDQLAQDQLRVADDGDLGRHLPADAAGHRIGLDVAGLLVPRRRLAEVLAAPEAEADGQHHVGASGERLLPRPAHGQRMILGNRPLARPTRVGGDVRQLDELPQLGARPRPEDAVTAGDQRPLRLQQELEGALDAGGIALRADLVRIVDLGAAPLPRLVVTVVEDVGGDLDQGRPLRRRQRLAKRLPQVDLDRAPVDHALDELGEAAAHVGAVRFLEGSQVVLRRRMLSRDAHHRAAGQPGDAQAGDGVGQTAAGRDAAHPRRGRRARVGVGGVGAGLLVPHVDQLDVVVAQIGQDRERVAAVDGEQVLDALLAQHATHQGTSVDDRHCPLSPCRCGPTVQRFAPVHLPRRAPAPAQGAIVTLMAPDLLSPAAAKPSPIRASGNRCVISVCSRSRCADSSSRATSKSALTPARP